MHTCISFDMLVIHRVIVLHLLDQIIVVPLLAIVKQIFIELVIFDLHLKFIFYDNFNPTLYLRYYKIPSASYKYVIQVINIPTSIT